MINDNEKLIARYPFLQHDYNDEANEFLTTYLDDIPIGWKNSFGLQMCEELRNILIEGECLDDYCVLQTKEKWGCYDEETEVLTKDGWKYFKDVTPEDEIAILDDDKETMVYSKPSDVISYHYKGKMYNLENRGVSLCVTPNHNLYVSKGSYFNSKKNNEKRAYDFELVTPDKYFGKDKRFKKGCKWNGVEPEKTYKIKGYTYTNKMIINGEDATRTYTKADLSFDLIPFIKFLGFYVAEGHTEHRYGNGSSIAIAYNYRSETEEKMVESLIKDIGYTPKQSGRGLKIFSDVSLTVWLQNNCGCLAWNKKVPQFIKNLPPKYIKIFLEYLFIGDGHKKRRQMY